MKTASIPLRNLEINFLMCSFYTLSKNHESFKKLDLKNGLYLEINKNINSSTNIEIAFPLYNLINQSALQEFAIILLAPFLNIKQLPLSIIINNRKKTGKLYNETLLLKKYLRKFKYNYHRHFFCQNKNFNTDKEINMYAIKSLFLIAGI